jgi:lipopolysaccharide export system protein LptA
MKRIIQLTLFLLLASIFFAIYKIYFQESKKVIIENNLKSINSSGSSLRSGNVKSKNNLIKNLKYEVTIDKNNQYIITSDLGEITYNNNGDELVLMKNVTGLLVDENNIPILIKSDNASYNNSDYNTNFFQNVKITYLNNNITSDKLDLNFKKKKILIHDNVNYQGQNQVIHTDNIEISLITKKISIYMDNNENSVKIELVK